MTAFTALLTKISAVSVFFFLPFVCRCQVPGYQGKKTAAEIGFCTFSGYGSSALTDELGFQVRLERVVGRKLSIGLIGEQLTLRLPNTALNQPNGLDAGYYDISGWQRTLGIQLIQYWSDTGWSLAPMGMYTGFGLLGDFFSGTSKPAEPGVAPLTESYNHNELSLFINWGKRLILNDQYALNFGVALAIPVLKSGDPTATTNQASFDQKLRDANYDFRLFVAVGSIF